MAENIKYVKGKALSGTDALWNAGGAAPGATPVVTASPTLSSSTLAQYAKQEITLPTLPAFTNPYDPAEVSIVATFNKPGGGTIAVHGFYMEPQAITFPASTLMFASAGAGKWMVRFTPTLTGTYTGTITVTMRDHATQTFSIPAFVVASSTDHGFIRLGASSKFLQYSDGAPYIPIGQNICTTWPSKGIYNSVVCMQLEQSIRECAVNGGNYGRLMATTAYKAALQWCNVAAYNYGVWQGYAPAGGDGFRMNQLSACALDRLCDVAQETGVCLSHNLSVDANTDDSYNGTYRSFYDFSPDYLTLGGNPYFNISPYFNGGPCATTMDFFTLSAAKTLFKKYLRYYIARYGYSTKLMNFEFLAEVDFGIDHLSSNPTEQTALIAAKLSWLTEMIAYVRSIDPYGHLISVEGGEGNRNYITGANPSSIWVNGISNLNWDLIGMQTYVTQFISQFPVSALGRNTGGLRNLIQTTQGLLPNMVLRSTEHGIDESTGDDADTLGIAIHNAMWITLVNGILPSSIWRTSPQYYATSHNLQHLPALAAFIAGENFETSFGSLSPSARRVSGSASNGCELDGLSNGTHVLAWIHDPNSYENNGTPAAIVGASVTITGLNSGTYDVELWNTYDGSHTTPTRVAGSTSWVVPLPTLSRDMAVKMAWYSSDVASAITLPQNLLTATGTLKEDFENTADWTLTACTIAADTTHVKTGTQSIAITNTGTNGFMVKTINWDLSSPSNARITFWVYLGAAAATDLSAIRLYLFNNTAMGNGMWANINIASLQPAPFLAGWVRVIVPKTSFSVVSAGTWASPFVRIRVNIDAVVGHTPTVSIDDLEFGETGIPAVCIWDDDGNIESYSNMFSYMKPLGIRGSISIDSHNIGFDGTFLNTAQVAEMAAAGWCLSNHTNSGADLTTLTEAQQETNISTCVTWLSGQGYTKGNYHLVYPSGGVNANTYTAIANLNILSGRLAGGCAPKLNSAGNICFALPWHDMRQIPVSPTTSSTVLADAKTGIDNAISGGLIYPFLFHRVGNTGQMTTVDFRSLIDYIYTKAKAGLINIITHDELYGLTLGPVSVPRIV